MTSRVWVSSYNAFRDLDRDIYACHYAVRLWQNEQTLQWWSPRDIGDSSDDLLDIAWYYLESGGNFWVARGPLWRVVGLIGLRVSDDQMRGWRDTGVVKRFAVLPEFQGQGVGSRLLGALMEYAEGAATADCHPLRRLRLTTGRTETARPMYERYGFVLDEDQPDPDEWRMTRTLYRARTRSLVL